MLKTQKSNICSDKPINQSITVTVHEILVINNLNNIYHK